MISVRETSSKKILSGSYGFTLIELLVVVGLIAVLTGGVIAGFSKFTEKQKVVVEALRLKSNLRQAQAKAISGYKPDSICSGSLNGYRATFTGDGYTLSIDCNASGIVPVQTVAMPPGISVASTAEFTFLPLTNGVSNAATITFTNVATGGTATITVSTSGDISGP